MYKVYNATGRHAEMLTSKMGNLSFFLGGKAASDRDK
jgi:hypothetical protein